MRIPAGLQTDETQLFREAVRDVKPLGSPAQASGAAVEPPPASASRGEASPAPTGSPFWKRACAMMSSTRRVASGEELVFHRAGIQAAVLRKLRRGDYRVQGEIDLHGLNVSEAKQALREFLAQALMRQWRCVRIIHGKGLRSGHRGPVLKGMVGAMLRKIGPVLAYVSARQVDGGTGAVYVLLSS